MTDVWLCIVSEAEDLDNRIFCNPCVSAKTFLTESCFVFIGVLYTLLYIGYHVGALLSRGYGLTCNH